MLQMEYFGGIHGPASCMDVKILYSPVAFSQYNGSCERSVGLVKENASMFAVQKHRSHAWTLEDI